MSDFAIPHTEVIVLVASLIIVIRGINLGFTVLHRIIDKRLPARVALPSEPRG